MMSVSQPELKTEPLECKIELQDCVVKTEVKNNNNEDDEECNNQECQSEKVVLFGHRLFTCNICDRQFAFVNSFKAHLTSHTDVSDKPYKCHICSHRMRGHLTVHMHIHLGTRFACAHCNKSYSAKDSLKRHMLQHSKTFTPQTTLEPTPKPFANSRRFQCSVCGYTTNSSEGLVKHVKTHGGDKPFKCDACDLSFARKDNMLSHLRTHSDSKPHSCNVCGYGCRKRDSLVKHMRTHTGEKPFVCNVCGYRCTRKDVLKNHVMMHAGDRPYYCGICSYSCTVRTNLVLHIKNRHRFRCFDCDYTCSKKKQFDEHKVVCRGESKK